TPEAAAALEPAIGAELERLQLTWKSAPLPELWFCCHPSYQSPDPFGPAISAEFAVPYVTADASSAAKRGRIAWASSQKRVGE
ncbi:glycosyltransferase family 1 protein, partial [Rhizobium ruizarguesonis]